MRNTWADVEMEYTCNIDLPWWFRLKMLIYGSMDVRVSMEVNRRVTRADARTQLGTPKSLHAKEKTTVSAAERATPGGGEGV